MFFLSIILFFTLRFVHLIDYFFIMTNHPYCSSIANQNEFFNLISKLLYFQFSVLKKFFCRLRRKDYKNNWIFSKNVCVEKEMEIRHVSSSTKSQDVDHDFGKNTVGPTAHASKLKIISTAAGEQDAWPILQYSSPTNPTACLWSLHMCMHRQLRHRS